MFTILVLSQWNLLPGFYAEYEVFASTELNERDSEKYAEVNMLNTNIEARPKKKLTSNRFCRRDSSVTGLEFSEES